MSGTRLVRRVLQRLLQFGIVIAPKVLHVRLSQVRPHVLRDGEEWTEREKSSAVISRKRRDLEGSES